MKIHQYSMFCLPGFDVNDAREIEILINAEGKMWVNIEGICHMRAIKTERIVIRDERPKKAPRRGLTASGFSE